MYIPNWARTGATGQAQVLTFHDAFAVSILFGLLGILFAPRIHDEDAAAALQATPSVATVKERSVIAAVR